MTTSPGPVHETAATTDDAALTFRGVDHVSLTVTDLNASAKFYTEVLGFTVVLDFGYSLACIHKTTGFTLSLIRHADGTGYPVHAEADRTGSSGTYRKEQGGTLELGATASRTGRGVHSGPGQRARPSLELPRPRWDRSGVLP